MGSCSSSSSQTPATQLSRGFTKQIPKLRIVVCADLDRGSVLPGDVYRSYLLKGHLAKTATGYKAEWDEEPVSCYSAENENGRGMELSELKWYNGALFTVDDKTGLVYQIVDDKVFPRCTLTEGDGSTDKKLKGEWMAVKDGFLIVGSHGTVVAPSGKSAGWNSQWVKAVSPAFTVQHIDWTEQFEAMKKALGVPAEGYVSHESGQWSEHLKQWVFLPRRVSGVRYETGQEGEQAPFRCSEDFKKIDIVSIGQLDVTRGYSSFQFIPGTEDQEILALKTADVNGEIATYVTAFKLDGTILLEDTKIGSYKYEGLEFLPVALKSPSVKKRQPNNPTETYFSSMRRSGEFSHKESRVSLE